jgi:hypothetical protein
MVLNFYFKNKQNYAKKMEIPSCATDSGWVVKTQNLGSKTQTLLPAQQQRGLAGRHWP